MDNTAYKLLELFNQRTSLSLLELAAILNVECRSIAEATYCLLDSGYLRKAITPDCDQESDFSFNLPLMITYKGKAALEEHRKTKRYYWFNELRAWITLAIALATFIKSFFG